MQNAAISDVDAAVTSFEGLTVRFAAWERPDIPASECALLEAEVLRLEQALPGLLPPFDPAYLRGSWTSAFGLYKTARVRQWLDVALTRLRAAQQRRTTDPLDIPAKEKAPTFEFVGAPGLQAILRRDFGEIERALVARCWKAAIILSGGIVEGLLIDAISRISADCPDAQGGGFNATARLRLVDLIRRAQEMRLVGQGVNKLSDTLREYRNLVHVAAEMRQGLRVDEHEARLALIILRMVERDLSELPR